MDISAISIYQDIQRYPTKEAKLKEACLEFESILISQMLKGLRGTVIKSGLLDSGLSREIWEDLLWTQYAKQMARAASFGLAEMLYKQMSKRLK